jgi:glycerol-3-phosphate dehydrogenase subunit C
VIERCSGHGGSWGIRTENFETALKVGKPVARQAASAGKAHVVSACPLAADHILQGMEKQSGEAPAVETATHPIEILAKAYGL